MNSFLLAHGCFGHDLDFASVVTLDLDFASVVLWTWTLRRSTFLLIGLLPLGFARLIYLMALSLLLIFFSKAPHAQYASDCFSAGSYLYVSPRLGLFNLPNIVDPPS